MNVSPYAHHSRKARLAAALLSLTALTACGEQPAKTGSAPTTSFTENGVTVTLSVSDWQPPRATLTAVFTPEEKGFHLYSTELPATGIEGVGRPTSMDVTGVLRADGKLKAAADVRTISVPGVDAPVPVYPDGPVTTTLAVRLEGKGKGKGNGDGNAGGDATVLLGYASCSSEEGCTIPVSDRPVHLHVTDEGPAFADR
ncbi:hypothetical protein [Streptomyces sp. NPDC059957]|uniref:hypothetical protein n=1 Tax=unclassified Streptomyces TaxID=2593676 RepID=UPI0036635136